MPISVNLSSSTEVADGGDVTPLYLGEWLKFGSSIESEVGDMRGLNASGPRATSHLLLVFVRALILFKSSCGKRMWRTGILRSAADAAEDGYRYSRPTA